MHNPKRFLRENIGCAPKMSEGGAGTPPPAEIDPRGFNPNTRVSRGSNAGLPPPPEENDMHGIGLGGKMSEGPIDPKVYRHMDPDSFDTDAFLAEPRPSEADEYPFASDTSAFLDPKLDAPPAERAQVPSAPIQPRPFGEQRARERAVVESISNFLRDKANLGLPGKKETKEIENIAQERVEGLYETFALKFVDSPFYESVTRAFRKIHSYKYLDHPTFKLSLESEMKSTGVPTETIAKALSTVDSLVEEFNKTPGERDSGWNQDRLEGIMDMTRNADRRKPEHEDPFNTPLI